MTPGSIRRFLNICTPPVWDDRYRERSLPAAPPVEHLLPKQDAFTESFPATEYVFLDLPDGSRVVEAVGPWPSGGPGYIQAWRGIECLECRGWKTLPGCTNRCADFTSCYCVPAETTYLMSGT